MSSIYFVRVLYERGKEGGESNVAIPGNRVGLGAKLGSTMNILNLKNDFTHLTVFKVLSQIYGNFKKLGFLKFISVRGDHFDYSSRAKKDLATTLFCSSVY